MQGLSVSRLVDVDVNLSPLAVPQNRFDTLLVMGDSTVIDTYEKVREYNGIEEVADDFLTTSPEYLAAALYFGQTPQPDTIFIGRWARTATSGQLNGGFLTATEQLISNWTGITNGGFAIQIDGAAAQQVSALNFSAITNMNAVASVINGALSGATIFWSGSFFYIRSNSTGATSTVGFAVAPAAGVNISTQLKLTSATAQYTVAGIAAETPVAAVTRIDGLSWYGLMFAAASANMPSDADNIAVSAFVQASTDKHLFGISSSDVDILNPVDTGDLASQLALANYTRTLVLYSSTSAYAVASWFGRAFTVNFEGSNTTITMMYKVLPGVVPETLTATQASTLETKRCNVYVTYNNGAPVTQFGVMSGQAYFDEMHGLDWLADSIQNTLFNLLRQSPKIPQTDAGVNILIAGCESDLSQGVNNGLIAEGTWNAPGFGQLKTGQILPKGWYIFAQSVNDQDQADREERIAPLIQIAVKLAGAIHKVNAVINVNR